MSKEPGHVYLSVPEGKPLTKQQKLDIAEIIYSRFYYYDGMYVWKDDRIRKTRDSLVQQVEQVVDAMKIKGIKI